MAAYTLVNDVSYKHNRMRWAYDEMYVCVDVYIVCMAGDRLLEVNGYNMRGVTHKEAIECLKKTGEVM